LGFGYGGSEISEVGGHWLIGNHGIGKFWA
jgi:hypothetical protein